MPIHDWTRVDAGIFHAFHHAWIEEISRALNAGILPPDYYALPEQHAAGLGPDVLTLQTRDHQAIDGGPTAMSGKSSQGGVSVLLSPPKVRVVTETDMEFYRRKQNAVVVRHVSGDRIVAVVEIVSPGNKSSRHAMRSFLEKTTTLLDQGVHLLILDVHSPTPRDPQGIHGVIWEEISGQDYVAPTDKPLTLVGYESGLTVRAFVEPIAVGDALCDMPLFLEPGEYILTPLEATYQSAYAVFPRRWKAVLEKTS